MVSKCKNKKKINLLINSDDSERSQSDESYGSFNEFSESSDESMIKSSVSKKGKKPTKVKSKAKIKADSEWVPIEEFIPDFYVKYKGSKASYENFLTFCRTVTPKPKNISSSSCIANKDTRFDKLDHWVDLVKENNQRKRCKLCGVTTTSRCIKCNVFLCLVRDRNCFYIYHHDTETDE